MSNCVFVETGNGNEKACARPGCGNRIISNDPPERCFATCGIVRGACIHRGAEIRRIACPSCNGNVQVKVLACDVHAECTIGQKVDGIPCCAECSEFVPTIQTNA